MYHLKHLRNDIVRFIKCFINGLLLLLLSLLLLVVVFVSDFQVFFLLFTMFFVKCNPYTLDSHDARCLVLLLNLALLTVPS